MSFYSKASKLLTNKYLLYFIVFLAVTNVFGYLAMNQLNAVIFFALVGVISSFFSKNMIIVLIICMFTTNMLMSNKTMREGLENATDPAKDEKASKPSQPTQATQPSSPPPSNDSPILPPIDINNMDMNKSMDNSTDPVGDISPMTTMNKKQNKNGSSSRIDYASTLEEAYDNLDKILGGDGIKNLTMDTQNLMSKQQELFQTMQTMTPMLNQAKQMLEGFDMKSLQGLAGLATNFTTGEKK